MWQLSTQGPIPGPLRLSAKRFRENANKWTKRIQVMSLPNYGRYGCSHIREMGWVTGMADLTGNLVPMAAMPIGWAENLKNWDTCSLLGPPNLWLAAGRFESCCTNESWLWFCPLLCAPCQLSARQTLWVLVSQFPIMLRLTHYKTDWHSGQRGRTL